MTGAWLTTITESPQEGFELAIVLSRRGVKYTQPDVDVLKALRPGYASSADALTAASHVMAVNFQTIAAANGYWRKDAASRSGRTQVSGTLQDGSHVAHP